MANTVRTLPGNVAMSSFSQSGAATANVAEMFGEKNKTVTVQGPYNGVQTGNSVATSDVVGVWADYSVYDYTVGDGTSKGNLDGNSTNFKDNA